MSHHRALAELESLTSAASVSSKSHAPTSPLIERLDEYPPFGSGGVDLTNLVPYPPRVEAVPVKPLFLDVAWNYIDYPGRTKTDVDRARDGGINGVDEGGLGKGEEKKEARKGWFGFGR